MKTLVALLLQLIYYSSALRLTMSTGFKGSSIQNSFFGEFHDQTDLGICPDSTGYNLAKSPHYNKGTSFTSTERNTLNLRGLVPAGEPIPLEDKVSNLMNLFRAKSSPLEKYIFLHTIQDSDETLYYAALVHHTTEVMPFVYTPTVGEACRKWSAIYRQSPRLH